MPWASAGRYFRGVCWIAHAWRLQHVRALRYLGRVSLASQNFIGAHGRSMSGEGRVGVKPEERTLVSLSFFYVLLCAHLGIRWSPHVGLPSWTSWPSLRPCQTGPGPTCRCPLPRVVWVAGLEAGLGAMPTRTPRLGPRTPRWTPLGVTARRKRRGVTAGVRTSTLVSTRTVGVRVNLSCLLR
jgi:hypothetical protein